MTARAPRWPTFGRGPSWASPWGWRTRKAASYPTESLAPARDYPYHDYAPSGRPGGRAPHVWLDEDRTISILDLFGGKFVVLTQSAVSPFLLAVYRMKQCDMPIEGYALEERFGGEALAEWRRIYGVQQAGAVLVRPDGVIAWRSRDGRGDLEAALHNILNPDPGASIPARGELT